jgi:Domain of unknown function (DUF5069)
LPLDQRLLNFLGVDPDALMSEIKLAKGDGELLEWILENANNKIAPWDIEPWSAYQDKRSPDSDAETILSFADKVGTCQVLMSMETVFRPAPICPSFP